jgi:hypothetical protein
MKGEQFPLGPDARSFVSQEHFPGHDDDVDFDLTTEERADIMAQKNAIEDAILDNIDNSYLESEEFTEDMRGVEEEEKKTMGWTTNFKSNSGGKYPNESEAEILDTAIKDIEKEDTRGDLDDDLDKTHPKISRKISVGKRDTFESTSRLHQSRPNNKRTHPRSQGLSDKN